MTFTRANPLGWAAYEVLTSVQINHIDLNQSRAVDGYAGGTFSPSSSISINNQINIDASPASGTNVTGLNVTGKGSSPGVEATGGTTGKGISATGGATSGVGVTAQGTGNDSGVEATGGGSGPGIEATGGSSSGVGVVANGGSGNAYGLEATGSGTRAGINCQGGSTVGEGIIATAIGNRPAGKFNRSSTGPNLMLAPDANDPSPYQDGDIWAEDTDDEVICVMDGKKHQVLDTWAYITAASGTITTVENNNCGAATATTTYIQIPFDRSFANTNYSAVATCQNSIYIPIIGTKATNYVRVAFYSLSTGSLIVANNDIFNFNLIIKGYMQ